MQELGSPFLLNLGVDIYHQAKTPTIEIPNVFNPNCSDLWESAVKSTVENKKYPSSKCPDLWCKVIKNFLDLCSYSNRFAFLETPEATNAEIIKSLIDKRYSILKAINFTIVNAKNSKRRVYFPDTGGFSISNSLSIKSPDIEDALREYSVDNSLYTLSPDDSTSIFLKNDITSDWVDFEYIITINTLPFLENVIPSTQELSKFILKILFEPILKSNFYKQCSYL